MVVAACLSVVPFALSFSIATDPATKMFLPLPAYLISSLWRSRFRSSVGSSRGSTAGTFPEAVRRTPGRVAVEVGCAATGTAAGDEGQNSRPSIKSAIMPNTASQMTCFRFSIPSFTQAPDRR